MESDESTAITWRLIARLIWAVAGLSLFVTYLLGPQDETLLFFAIACLVWSLPPPYPFQRFDHYRDFWIAVFLTFLVFSPAVLLSYLVLNSMIMSFVVVGVVMLTWKIASLLRDFLNANRLRL